MLKAGTYNAKGVRAQLGLTQNGKEQVAVELAIIDEGDCFGQRITWYGYFTERTTERTLDSLRHLGWAGDDLFNLDGVDQNEVSIVVEEEEYDGKTRLKVQWVNAKGGLALQRPMDDAQAQAFAHRMRGEVLKHKSAYGAPRSQRSTAPANGRGDNHAPPPGDDDIPF